MLAVALLKKGFQVQLFERDVTAIRGEGKYRGPIQVGTRDWHVLSCSGCQIWQICQHHHSHVLPLGLASWLAACQQVCDDALGVTGNCPPLVWSQDKYIVHANICRSAGCWHLLQGISAPNELQA